ncbi:hypothetical protein HPB51_017035 [Rhipicephalus microplus]|uniref:Uncharacterized protein n=1 Tax=Rhipicephalus microplus TaxID=6941 RepID=A0A9J6F448_RHIMP|nr:hypothetical protein HPB51_017035 [Rhipicephalus microplus]
MADLMLMGAVTFAPFEAPLLFLPLFLSSSSSSRSCCCFFCRVSGRFVSYLSSAGCPLFLATDALGRKAYSRQPSSPGTGRGWLRYISRRFVLVLHLLSYSTLLRLGDPLLFSHSKRARSAHARLLVKDCGSDSQPWSSLPPPWMGSLGTVPYCSAPAAYTNERREQRSKAKTRAGPPRVEGPPRLLYRADVGQWAAAAVTWAALPSTTLHSAAAPVSRQ